MFQTLVHSPDLFVILFLRFLSNIIYMELKDDGCQIMPFFSSVYCYNKKTISLMHGLIRLKDFIG